MNPSHAPFNSAHVRARIVKILLMVDAGVTVLVLLAESFSLVFPPLKVGQEASENVAGTVIALLIFLLGILEFTVYLVTVVFFLMWLYRASNNLRAFNPWNRTEYSAGWAVGSFFVPFVNLVVPYRAVKEVWQKSVSAEDALLAEPSAPASFPLWWLFWLLSRFASNISFRLNFNDNVEDGAATMVSILASALSIVAAVFAYSVVDAIDKRQEETSRKANLGRFPGPPPPPPAYPPLSDVVAPAP